MLSYFPLHNLSVTKDFFRWWDVLIYVEGTIYALDEHNEDVTATQVHGGTVQPPPSEEGQQTVGQACLVHVLQAKGLWDDRISAEFEQGLGYWRMERQLCSAMAQRSSSLLDGAATTGLTLAAVHQASEAKSFDYRLLHLLLHRLQGVGYEEALLAFLGVDELLVDIGDDLVDYEDDVLKNSFNVYRAYLHLFGQQAQLQLIDRIGQLETRHTELQAKLPAEIREKYLARQREAADVPGSEKWVFPQPIWDEAAYRQDVGQLSDSK